MGSIESENNESAGILTQAVFVYGTLRRGEANHHWLGNAPFLGQHRTPARYTLLDLGSYPAAVANGHTAIVGELYGLDDSLLARLDELEDYPREYTRAVIPVPQGRAWMYLYRRPPSGAMVIAGGDWSRRRRGLSANPAG
ncbi:MAG: gamma-glutamylcyclotransferase [Candidatus Competibacteraceae bacterium]|nr:gamma-glutamylcyclotransferase [Candidatus Competibacteraceae bacterium]